MRLLRSLLVLYLIYGAVMIWAHPRFIYPFSDRPFDAAQFERIALPVAGGTDVQAYLSDGPRNSPIILYFMGNLGSVALFHPMLDHHRRAGRGVVAMTFRGGGGISGTSSEEVLKRDALATYDGIRARYPGRKIIVHGYSLGTGLAVHVAARREVAGVVLSAPYDSLCRIMTMASALPACYLPVQRWDSGAEATQVGAPVLVLHGTLDQVVPFSEGKRLARRFNHPNQLTHVALKGAGHNGLFATPGYLPAIDRFIKGL